jgi:predicted nucleotidyltransferase
MGELGQDISEFEKEETPNPRKSFFKLEFDGFYLDFLPEIKSRIIFSEAYQRKETILFEGVTFNLIHFKDLILDKETSAREKDLEDIEQLNKLKGMK